MASSSASASAAAAEAYTGCSHYKRGCLKRAPCCPAGDGSFFGCRFCHDAVKYPDGAGFDPKKAHKMDRFAVCEMKCMQVKADGTLCGLVQLPAQACVGCGARLGDYYCDICHLWDNEGRKKQLYHCEGCGICRVGGRENFFHCDGCGSCLSLALKGSHACRAGSMKADCPVCLEDLHSSRTPAALLKCGHAMHTTCLAEYSRTNFKCPLCAKSLADMTAHWRETDVEVALMPMPTEYAHLRVPVLCNDCGLTGTAPFHIRGIKCQSCGSYNTKRVVVSGASASSSAAASSGGDDEDPLAGAVPASAAQAAAAEAAAAVPATPASLLEPLSAASRAAASGQPHTTATAAFGHAVGALVTAVSGAPSSSSDANTAAKEAVALMPAIMQAVAGLRVAGGAVGAMARQLHAEAHAALPAPPVAPASDSEGVNPLLLQLQRLRARLPPPILPGAGAGAGTDEEHLQMLLNMIGADGGEDDEEDEDEGEMSEGDEEEEDSEAEEDSEEHGEEGETGRQGQGGSSEQMD